MGLWGFVVNVISMTSTFVNILVFVRNKYHPLGMQRVQISSNSLQDTENPFVYSLECICIPSSFEF